MTQAQRTLEYLKEHGSITSLEGITELGILSFPKRICELRALGYDITSKTETVRNRYGEKTQVKRYFLTGEEN